MNFRELIELNLNLYHKKISDVNILEKVDFKNISFNKSEKVNIKD